MEHDFTDNETVYITQEDGELELVICPEGDCGSIKLKTLLKVIAKKDPALYMEFVDGKMMQIYT